MDAQAKQRTMFLCMILDSQEQSLAAEVIQFLLHCVQVWHNTENGLDAVVSTEPETVGDRNWNE